MNSVEAAVHQGWVVGVCGWQHREEQAVSDGAGGVREDTVGCDFITEFIAPGGGYGRVGAGTEMLMELRRRCMNSGGVEVHGHVWKHKGRARTWWGNRGMVTTWTCAEGDGWGDGAGMTRRMFETDNEGEYGYMRCKWEDIKVGRGGE